MTESSTTPEEQPAATPVDDNTPEEQPKATVRDHLRAIHELQSTLVVEQRKDAVLRAGTLAVIELVGLECGVALIDPSPGRDAIRFGQRGGRGMAQHEIEVLARSLDKEILEVRSGKVTRVALATSPAAGENDCAGEPPGAVQSRDLASVLILGIGGAGRRDGVMILGRRTPEAFTSEELALAELLVLQLSAHYERVHGRNEATRVQEEAGAVTHILQDRNRELEALIAIQSTVGLTFDSDRHMDAILNKAVEVTGHSGALLYLVEKDEQGDEVLRCVRGVGDPACIERARQMVWHRGETPVGSVWESGEAVVRGDLGSDSTVNDSQMLLRAGYHRTMWLALRARGRNLGVLQLLGGVESSYAPSEQRLCLTVADQVATTIHDGRLLADMMRHNLELEQRTYGLQSELKGFEHQLQGIRGAIAAADGSGFGQARLEGFLPGVVALLESEAGAVYLQEAGSPELTLRFQHGYPPDQHADLEADYPLLRETLKSNEAAVLNLVKGDCPEGTDWMERDGYRSLTVIPFRAQEGARGVLAVAGCKERSAGERRPLHEVVASLAGLVSEDESEPERPAPSRANGQQQKARPVDAPDLQAQLVQAQKMESVGTLAGGIAHHFNNILACIMGYASHIKGLVPESHPVHAKAVIIEQQSERAAVLTNQLRGFARGGEGRRQLVDVNAMLRDTVSFLSKSIDPCIHLDVACAPDLPAVEADPGLLRQVLLNIAINARDAMPGGGRINFESRIDDIDEMAVKSIPSLGPGMYVVMEINDTGPGMQVGVVDRACEPFFTTKPSGAGTGLGLSVAYGIVRNHGGHLALSSAHGVGTAVSIYLPATGQPVPVAAEPKAGTEAATPAEAPPVEAEPESDTVQSENAETNWGWSSPAETSKPSEAVNSSEASASVDSSGSSEEPESSESGKPSTSVESAASIETPESMESLESVESVESVESAGSAEPSASADTSESAEQSETAESLDSANSSESVEPSESVDSSESDESVASAESSEPVEPPSSAEPASDAVESPEQQDAQNTDVPAGVTETDRAPQPGLRILVVDDEESLRRMTGEMLIDAGYEVCSGKDGVEALQLYRQHWGEIHLVILDMVMPRLGGLETFRRIRGMDRKARILLYSGYDRNEQALQAIREGALGLLAKPFGKSELLQWVRKVLPEN